VDLIVKLAGVPAVDVGAGPSLTASIGAAWISEAQNPNARRKHTDSATRRANIHIPCDDIRIVNASVGVARWYSKHLQQMTRGDDESSIPLPTFGKSRLMGAFAGALERPQLRSSGSRARQDSMRRHPFAG